MHRYLWKAAGITENQGIMTPAKKHSKLLVTDLKEVEIPKLPDETF